MNGKIEIAIILTDVCEERWLYTQTLQLLRDMKKQGILDRTEFKLSSMSKMKNSFIKVFKQTKVFYNLVLLQDNDIHHYKMHQLELLMGTQAAIVIEGAEINPHLDSLFKSFRTKLICIPKKGVSLCNAELLSLTEEVKL